jgi:hypothetical protein
MSLFPDFSPEITAGVAKLDAEAPGWLDAIDLGRMRISSANWCVLAQVAQRQWPIACVRTLADPQDSPYAVGLRKFGLHHGRRHGFYPPKGYESPWYWWQLGRQWKRRIRQLRVQRAANRREFDLAR